MMMKANGYNPNIAQWIAAAISVLFGKKYNEATGAITGSSEVGIGEPVATTGAAIGSAEWWAATIITFVTTMGTTYILAKTNPAPGDPGFQGSPFPGTPPPGTSALLPILLIGGAAAAYFILKPKTKK